MVNKGALKGRLRFDREFSNRGVRLRQSRHPFGFRERVYGEDHDFNIANRLNSYGFRKGVARCFVPDCMCNARRGERWLMDDARDNGPYVF